MGTNSRSAPKASLLHIAISIYINKYYNCTARTLSYSIYKCRNAGI